MKVQIINCKDCISKFNYYKGKKLERHFKKQSKLCKGTGLERCSNCIQLLQYEQQNNT